MSDEDDYFTDDISFDDQTLAILDRVEQKYLSQAVRTATVPPSKRQRTDNGWTAGIGTPSIIVSEFLPEISLNLAGSYGILPSASNSANILPRPLSSNNFSTSSDQSSLPNIRSVQSVSTKLLHTISARSVQQSRPPISSHHPQRPNSHSEFAGLAQDTGPTSLSIPRKSTSSDLLSRDHDQKHALEEQLQELQQRLDKMSEDNKTIQIALNEAMNAKLAKEGEVTILRRNVEKAAHEHAAQLATLKAAREEADAKQARIQKDLREEAERLKTQLVFKQHEQESTFKPARSVRSKKNMQDVSFTAKSTPSHLRSQTHDMPHTGRTSMLPGFENAFNNANFSSSPKAFNQETQPFSYKNGLRPSSGNPDLVSVFPVNHERPELTAGADVSMDLWADENVVELAHGNISMPSGTVELDRQTKVEDVDMEPTHASGPSIWKVELNRIMLMHILPSARTLTVQLLLGVQTDTILGSVLSDTYMAACSRCLQIIASASNGEQDWRYLVETLCQSLLSIIPLLRATHSVLPLAALLNLLAMLIYSLPDFGSLIMSQPCDAGTSDSCILVYLSEIVLDHREMEKLDFWEVLSTEVVTLLEALAYSVPPELVGRLAYISYNRQVLMNLFRANQPSWLLARSGRLLVILASHHKLCRFLLSMPDPELSPEEKATDPQKIPLVERLCLYLIDAGRKDADYKEAKTSILTFFALLSNSHAEVHAHLLLSTTVIPSLVFFLAQLTAAFWEDDEELMSASSDEVTMDILDHVVDGPEADRTWQAYQVEGERFNDTDEEEMEEQLLGGRK
ncbi:hypothetical protein C0992_013204 [Termitomyces sp. T32_za158]|nr:hypothetical protein C0992_013204 [Termitomyces sp. T32_za158]